MLFFFFCLKMAFANFVLIIQYPVDWWRLRVNPASNNELLSIELSWVWEPTYREGARWNSLGKRSLCCVLGRDINRWSKPRGYSEKYWFDHQWVVPREGRSGGLVLYWKDSINLKVEGSGKNYIDAIIDKNTETEWRLTSFYWEPETARRIEAWDIVRNLNSRLDSPWLCCGDFNEIIK